MSDDTNSNGNGQNGERVESLLRAMDLLRAVARVGAGGRRLSDLARDTGLHKATAARLLNTLEGNGVLRRDDDRRYRMHAAFLQALGMPVSAAQLRAKARPEISAVVEAIEDLALLSVRSGYEALCIDRQVGRYPLQALSLDVGRRRPLGVGAGSLALLSWLPQEERAAILAAEREKLAQFPNAQPERIEALAKEARERGYTYLPDFVITGMTGIGAPVRDTAGEVIAAVSIAAVGERLKGARGGAAANLLLAARDRIEARLAGSQPSTQPLQLRLDFQF